MGDRVPVSSRDAFVADVAGNDDNQLDDDAASELYDIWQFRMENSSDDVLVLVPGWFAGNEFGKRRPAFFANVEHDDPSKGAVLFADARMVDVSVLENQVWDRVSISETLEMIDISDDDDYIDDAGKIWIPRSLMEIYEWDE